MLSDGLVNTRTARKIIGRPNKDFSMIYLASPYTHPDPKVRESRFHDVCKVAGRLMQKGHHVFSPIVHSHPISIVCGLPTVWKFWKKHDVDFLKWCTQLWIAQFSGWNESVGVSKEIKIVQRMKKPIYYVDPVFLKISKTPHKTPCV